MKKFKTIKEHLYPSFKDSRDCPCCGKSLTDGQFIINVGGFPIGKGVKEKNILGLFSIIRHFHDDKDGCIDIIDDQSQVDMQFCSKKCVIKFFKNVLKRLED